MSQKVETYLLPFEKGGVCANPNIDLIEPTQMDISSRNTDLRNGGREKRGGTSINYTMPSTPRVMGIHDFTLETGTQKIIVCTKDGKVYKDSTTTIKTGMSTTNHFNMMTLRDILYICDGETRPQVWDGAAAGTSNIASIPSDWSGSNFPKFMFTHSNGAAYRNLAFGVPGLLDVLYCSASNDGQDFSDANVVKVIIPTNDGFGIVAGGEFGERAILFGKSRAYILNDADPIVANWGYVPAQWKGGVANERLLVRTPNDMFAMAEDGDIYSILAVQQYGDYQAASISRPSFMHTWISKNVDLSSINDFHATYDPAIRAVKFFVKLIGKSTNDTALVYFVDRDPKEAWAIYDNDVSNSGYKASASALVRKSDKSYVVYTGGYSGEVWSLETSTKSDGVNGYTFSPKTPYLTFGDARKKKLYTNGRLTLIQRGDFDLTIRWWVDSSPQPDILLSPTTVGGVYGSGVYGSSVYGGEDIIDSEFELGQIGSRISLQFVNSDPGEDFFMSAGYVDFKWIGKYSV